MPARGRGYLASVSAASRVLAACRRSSDDRTFRLEVLEALRSAVDFDAHVWLLTDPATTVGSSPLADVPSLGALPETIRLKYLCPENRWTALESPRAVSLAAAGGEAGEWHGLLDRYAVRDVASVVLSDHQGCWGFLDLWRVGAVFAQRELDLLTETLAPVAEGLRAREALQFEVGGSDLPSDPAVLLLAPDLTVRRQTPAAESYLRALLPTPDDRRPVPAAAYNVAAQLLAVEAGVDPHPAWSRVWSRPGLLLTFRAARIHRRDRPMDTSDIAVTIERTTPGERLDLFGRVHDLSPRETDVLRCLTQGDDTREVAARLHLSAYTVQDHLTSVFDKTGVRSRRALLARATG